MPEIESYNILVIGSGEAGKYLAWTMAKAGHRTLSSSERLAAPAPILPASRART